MSGGVGLIVWFGKRVVVCQLFEGEIVSCGFMILV